MPPKIGKLNCLWTLGRFIVGEAGKSHASIAELRDLKHLSGMLEIEHLERVKSKEEAQGAKLDEKKNLRQLSLQWNRDAGQGIIADDEVLESLAPAASSLLSLQLSGYRGAHFPPWVSRMTLENVVTVFLYCETRCSSFPSPLEELPHLRDLAVKGFDGVEYLASGVYQGRSVYPSLESLKLQEFPNLKGLFVEGPGEEPRRGEEELMAFPRLRELRIISGCPLLSLTCLPSLQRLAVSGSTTPYTSLTSARLSALTSLVLNCNDEVISFPQEMLQNLTALKSLEISRYGGLKELATSFANLTALDELRIKYCPELETLPEQGLQGLISLTKLSILECKKLKSLSEGLGHLTSLESLLIYRCPELMDLPPGIGNLSGLREIDLHGNWEKSEMTELPEALRHVSSLHDLRIYCFGKLLRLPDWLRELTSLRSLMISNCPELESLPAVLSSMTNLQQLSIMYCPKLEKRYEKGKGPDWNLISHIPSVTFHRELILPLYG